MINRRNMLSGLAGTMAFAAAGGKSFAHQDPNSIVRAVSDIVEGIERRRDRTHSSKTLYVPMGEMHESAAQKLVLQSVLQELRERGHKIAFGFEDDYDILSELTEVEETPPLPEYAYRLVDPDGKQTLRYLNHMPRVFIYADQSTKSLFNFCEQQNISTAFNDLSKRRVPGFGSLIIDPDDGLAQQLIEELGFDVNGVLDTRDPVAIAVRNAAIVYNAFNHAADAKAEIYVQHCGFAHLFGGGPFLTFDKTLASLFSIGGNGVYAVDLYGLAGTPREARAMEVRGDALSIGYLSPDRYNYGKLGEHRQAIEQLQQKERTYLENATRNTKFHIYKAQDNKGIPEEFDSIKTPEFPAP